MNGVAISADAIDPMSSVGSSSTVISELPLIQWIQSWERRHYMNSLGRRLPDFGFTESSKRLKKSLWHSKWQGNVYFYPVKAGDEDDEMWKVSKTSGKRLLWNEPRSSGEIIDMSCHFGYDASHAICSLNVAVILARYKFDSEAINYLEIATVRQPSFDRYYEILGTRACKDQRVEDALLYFDFADRDLVFDAFMQAGNFRVTGVTRCSMGRSYRCYQSIQQNR